MVTETPIPEPEAQGEQLKRRLRHLRRIFRRAPRDIQVRATGTSSLANGSSGVEEFLPAWKPTFDGMMKDRRKEEPPRADTEPPEVGRAAIDRYVEEHPDEVAALAERIRARGEGLVKHGL